MTESETQAESVVPEAGPESDWVLYDDDWLRDEGRDGGIAETVAPPVAVSPRRRPPGEWAGEAVRGLIDFRFRRTATRTLLPVVYALGLVFAVAVPVLLSVPVFHVSTVLGVLFLLVVAPLLMVTIAATVRLMLEFLVSATILASRVNHITVIADDLMTVLNEVAAPVSQLSEDVRAVQFWRFRNKRRR